MHELEHAHLAVDQAHDPKPIQSPIQIKRKDPLFSKFPHIEAIDYKRHTSCCTNDLWWCTEYTRSWCLPVSDPSSLAIVADGVELEVIEATCFSLRTGTMAAPAKPQVDLFPRCWGGHGPQSPTWCRTIFSSSPPAKNSAKYRRLREIFQKIYMIR